MVEFNNAYVFISLVSSIVTLLFSFCLLACLVPPEPEFKNYRLSRKLLACAYIILSIGGIYEYFASQAPSDITHLTHITTLIVASLQAFLFSFSIITLIDIRFITIKRILSHFIPIVIFAVILMYSLSRPREMNFTGLLVFGLCCYVIQLSYYIWLFNCEYKKYRIQLDNFFSGDEERRMLWVRKVFYLSLSIGILIIASLFMNTYYYSIFEVAYTLFYVYFAVKYINYIPTFRSLLPAINLNEESGKKNMFDTSELEEKITQWVAEKRFIQNGITLEMLSVELGTNHSYLSRYINTGKNQNFKVWISSLRIKESKRLLIEKPNVPIASIAEEVGIGGKGSFFRQFMNITGMTPGEYREKMLK